MNVTRSLKVLGSAADDTLMRVAFASSDNRQVDQHFGSTLSLTIYGVDADQFRLLKIVAFEEIKPDDDDKLVEKLAALDNCIAVYCRACGASAVRQLHAQGVQPVKVNDGSDIQELIEALQQELKEGPSSWLAKAIRRHQLTASSGFESRGDWQE